MQDRCGHPASRVAKINRQCSFPGEDRTPGAAPFNGGAQPQLVVRRYRIWDPAPRSPTSRSVTRRQQNDPWPGAGKAKRIQFVDYCVRRLVSIHVRCVVPNWKAGVVADRTAAGHRSTTPAWQGIFRCRCSVGRVRASNFAVRQRGRRRAHFPNLQAFADRLTRGCLRRWEPPQADPRPKYSSIGGPTPPDQASANQRTGSGITTGPWRVHMGREAGSAPSVKASKTSNPLN